MSTWIKSFEILASALLVVACAPISSPASPAPLAIYPAHDCPALAAAGTPPKIALVGDSIMHATAPHLNASLTCQELWDWAADGSTPSDEHAGAGNIDWPAQRINDVIAHHPDVVIFAFVCNSNTWPQPPAFVQQCAAGQTRMIRAAQAIDARVIVAIPSKVGCSATDPVTNRYDAYRLYVSTQPWAVDYVDWYSALGGDRGIITYNSGDCVHPNGPGDDLLARATAKAIL